MIETRVQSQVLGITSDLSRIYSEIRDVVRKLEAVPSPDQRYVLSAAELHRMTGHIASLIRQVEEAAEI